MRFRRELLTWYTAAVLAGLGVPMWAQCGGTERWPVKVGTDPGAAKVDVAHPNVKDLSELIGLPALPLVARGDNTTRRPEETRVYSVTCHLVKFKLEGGKGDQDYHCVLSDDSLSFTDDAHGVEPGHSIVGEVVNPSCVTGAHGDGPTSSIWQDKLEAVRSKMDARFPNIPASGAWVDAKGVQVRVTGVAFFDRTHRQTGRTGNGATTFEIHPILDIEFLDGSSSTPNGALTASIVSPASDESVENESAVSFSGKAISNAAGATFSYTWNFGDGGTASGSNANHTFTNPGNSPLTYTVTFSVTDDNGHTSQATRTITVAASPGPANTFYSHEPNNAMDTAQAIPEGVSQVAGYFQSNSDDNDYYFVELPAGRTLTLDLSGPTDQNQDYDLYLFSSSGSQLAKSTGDSTSEHLSFKNTNQTKAKTVFILVTRYKGFSDATPYLLRIDRGNQ